MDLTRARLSFAGPSLPGRLALATVPVIAIAAFYAWPVATLVVRALDPTSFAATFERAGTWDIIWFSAWQAVASTVLTLIVGLAPAWVLARFEFRGRRLLSGLLTAVFVMPTVVMGAAFLALLPDWADHTVAAVLAAHIVFNLAVVVRTAGPLWARLPDDLEYAAAALGASPWQRFRLVTLPLLRPALASASAIIFLFTFTSFGVIRVLGAPGTATIEVEVWRRATQIGDIGSATVLSLLQFVILAVIVAVSTWIQRRAGRALELEPHARRRTQHPTERRWVAATVATTYAICLAPLVALVAASVSTPTGWSLSAWTNLGDTEVRPGIRLGPDPFDAIANSVSTAAWATLFATVTGGLASLAIASARRAGRVLDVALMLPLATSAVTIGFGMLITFDRDPFDWRASWWLVPVGQALVAVPFVVRNTVTVLRAVDPQLQAAAATLGATPNRAWATVVVPFLWRPLSVSAAMAAAISLGEFGATSFLSRSGGETIPIAIEQLVGRTGSTLQARGYVLATLLAVATIAMVTLIDRDGRPAALGSNPSPGRDAGDRLALPAGVQRQ